MKTIINCIKRIFNGKKLFLLDSTTNQNEHDTTERNIMSANESEKNETDIDDVTSFYGKKQFSPNNTFCVSFADGHYSNNKWKYGYIALIKGNYLLFKKKVQRPNDCFVSNNGIVICCDWMSSESLSGQFFIFDLTGEEIFSKRLTANLGSCAISENSEIALFETHNSDTKDGNKIFIIDIVKKEIIKIIERPASFHLVKLQTDRKRINLVNHKGLVYEIDFEGNHTNKNDYENQILTTGSIYEKLLWFAHKPEEVKLKDPKYLEILITALADEKASFSIGKAKIFRLIGDYHEANGNIDKTIENWEKALSFNPKIGVKRKLEVLKNQRNYNEQ